MKSSERVRTVIISVVAAILASGGVATASHQFSDIPTNSFFHDAISAIYDGGCASGYNDGEFKSGNSATRGQFSYWLRNCGGRVALGETQSATLTTGFANVVQQNMDAGALPAGGGFVKADVAIETSTTSAAFLPCTASFKLVRVGGNGGGNEELAINISDSASATELGHASMTDLVPVTGGTTLTVALQAEVDAACTATVVAEASLNLTYFPFDGTGAGGGATTEFSDVPEP